MSLLPGGRFYEHLMPAAPEGLRLIAPDMRGFGDTEHVPIDATRGLADWADDVDALLRALGVSRPPHLAGWSTGGAAIAAYALARPVASLTFIDRSDRTATAASGATAHRAGPTSRARAAGPAPRTSRTASRAATGRRTSRRRRAT
jgi:pimeloyl-ACP methyl ester carboxylesterase